MRKSLAKIRVPGSIHGTNSNVTGVTTAQCLLDIFVGGCSLSTNEGDITPLCDGHGITVESCIIQGDSGVDVLN